MLTQIVRGVQAFDFCGAFNTGSGGADHVRCGFLLVVDRVLICLHQTETHTTSDGVLFAVWHVERPDNNPRKDRKEKVNENGRNCVFG